MVIAHVIHSFHVGGQEMMAVELASRQVARGNRVIAISLAPDGPGALTDAFSRVGVRTLHIAKRGPTIDSTLPVRLAMAFFRNSVDVVHLHNEQPLIYGALAGKLAGCRVIATRHGLVIGSRRQLWLRRQAGRMVDSDVSVSAEVANSTRDHRLIDERKMTVIENGIDLDRYRPRADLRAEVRTELGLANDSLVVGIVCRLVECKNVGLLLRAALPHLGASTQLLIIGDGPERSRLEALASQSPQGKFARFLGQRTDVARLLNGLDLFALSSSTEGHPISVIEAMATGLPVLATKVGGIPEMIEDGKTGFLAPDDERSYAERLTAALEQKASWPAMGETARTVAHARFSSATMTDRYLELYQSVRGGAKP
jgi:glycosyltransferase involved in cell wall biosynthesis